MSIAAVGWSHCLIAKCHVYQSLLVGEATEVVQLFALKLILSAFIIWCIVNQGDDGTDAINQNCSLRGISVVYQELMD
jgi:uncharacterized membrane protein YhaH (DUF805 family)